MPERRRAPAAVTGHAGTPAALPDIRDSTVSWPIICCAMSTEGPRRRLESCPARQVLPARLAPPAGISAGIVAGRACDYGAPPVLVPGARPAAPADGLVLGSACALAGPQCIWRTATCSVRGALMPPHALARPPCRAAVAFLMLALRPPSGRVRPVWSGAAPPPLCRISALCAGARGATSLRVASLQGP